MHTETVEIGGRTIELETGRIARQAHGAILLRQGKTVLLSTVVYNPSQEKSFDFFPLTVDYKEVLAAAGRIPGSFNRREGRQNDHETLASRFCDRSMRPLFPKGFRAETQVLSTVLSHDPETEPGVLSIVAAAAAVHISEIPFDGPVVSARVARLGDGWVVYPTPAQRDEATLDLLVSYSPQGVVMLEGGGQEASEAQMAEALEFGRQAMEPLFAALERLRQKAGRPKVALAAEPEPGEQAVKAAQQAEGALMKALALPEKQARHQAVAQAKSQAKEALAAQLGEGAGPLLLGQLEGLLDKLEKQLMRRAIVEQKRRVDGRGPEEIRPIECLVDWLPSPHGSALFTRGETQAMVTLTLGAKQDRQLVESLNGVNYSRFMLHYNFPSYSVGEVRANRGPGRREIGHGALALRALAPVLPTDEQFPYTIRIYSEISESNGSSSMATVCGGALALMDGGVPILAPVAGIAMGLIQEGETYEVLSDILGDEDHLGDMDFKVAGTAKGITAIQMDNKLGALPPQVMARALDQARKGRLHILDKMAQAIKAPRAELKPQVPIVATVAIAPNRVRDLIGPGGKIIQEIQRVTETRIEVTDDGTVRIYAPNREALQACREKVLDVAGTLTEGDLYDGVVTGVKEFGAFVRVRGQEGLVHVSEWANERVDDMNAVAKMGDPVKVRVLGPDKTGKLKLSRKAAL